jgi:SAM-dependent methyltransferase
LIPFAARGFNCVGVDLSVEMLRVAGMKAENAKVAVELHHANIVELEFLTDSSFDYVACLFSTLGMVSGSEERQRVINHAFRLLKPGGRFVLHVHNWWHNLRDRDGRKWWFRDIVRKVRRDRKAGDRRAPAHQGIGGFSLHHFTRRETCIMLRRAGFHVTRVQPISTRPDSHLPWSWFLGNVRAYGFLVCAERSTEPIHRSR